MIKYNNQYYTKEKTTSLGCDWNATKTLCDNFITTPCHILQHIHVAGKLCNTRAKGIQYMCVVQGTSVEPKQKSRIGSRFSLYFTLINFTEHVRYTEYKKKCIYVGGGLGWMLLVMNNPFTHSIFLPNNRLLISMSSQSASYRFK